MGKKGQRISKSQYLRGIQCPKALWLYRNRPDLTPEISEAQQRIFDTGHEIGELAKAYFRSGVEIVAEYYEIDKAIELTRAAINQGENTLFEATACSPDGAFSRIDILKHDKGPGAWDLIEVKASTGVKDYHISDMALQRYAFTGAGFIIGDSVLMHVNSQYVRSGDLNVKQLFTLQDCTERVTEKMADVGREVERLLLMLRETTEPDIEIGDQCHHPFACDYLNYCWQHVPDYSVYNVFRGSKLEQLLAGGIVDIADVPDGFDTTDRQFIDISAFQQNRIHVDKAAINGFLEELVYPLYFLDYETINPAVPLFDNTRPYQQIPFQFSLHVQQRRGGGLKHIEFLHTGQGDPRPDFIKSLIAGCGKSGSVVVYNLSFESRINNELGGDFPEFSGELNGITDRMVDLLVPFRSRAIYHPSMQGSASLKAVLPAFVRDMSYDDMAIGDGGTASMAYFRLHQGSGR